MATSKKAQTYRIWLQSELTVRCRKNPAYSMRAFARLLKIDASSLSQILSGTRRASPKMISRFCNALAVSPDTREALVRSASARGAREKSLSEGLEFQQLSADVFAVIADWYHYAILELTYVRNMRPTARWIAKALGIRVSEARLALERLKRLSLLKEADGKLVKTEERVTNFSPGFTAPPLKELQRQLLKKALTAIDESSAEEKDITSITFAAHVEKLDEARERIRTFRRSLCSFLEEGTGSPQRVYNLNIQLFPISINQKEKG